MKTIRVVAAVICSSLLHKDRVLATARGYGAYKGMWEFPGGKLEAGETNSVTLKHGILKSEDSTIIYVGVDNAESNLQVKYNGIPLACEGKSINSYLADKRNYPILAYRVPSEAVKDSLSGEISFSAEKAVTVYYTELMNGKE